MPHYPACTGAIVVASLAFATALAIYESPQARQFAQDFRRKMAVALYALGDEINPKPSEGQPRYNRPEDAEESSRNEANSSMENGVNEDARRHQREELLYWNAMKLANEEKQRQFTEENQRHIYESEPEMGECRQDKVNLSDQETYVCNSVTDPAQEVEKSLRGRGTESFISDTNPFSDRYYIHPEYDSSADNSFIIPKYASSQTTISDMYNTVDTYVHTPFEVDVQENHHEIESNDTTEIQDVFASISAWAESARTGSNINTSNSSVSKSPNSNQRSATIDFESSSTDHDTNSFTTYSGDLTPTDSVSLAGSIGETLWEGQSGVPSVAETLDDMSLNGESSIAGTWSEIESVISENDLP